MNALWKRWSALFDALGKRERILVFSAAVFALAMIGYQFTIEPHRVRHAALSKSLAQQQSERTAIEAGVILSEARARAPDAENRAALLALRSRIAQVESQYRSVHDNLVAPEKMAELAQTLLRRNRGLQLVAMTTLPASPIVAVLPPAAAQAGMPAAAIVVPGQDSGLYKHGVQITVRGSYADMTSYLVQLESLPQKMYWGRIEVLTEEYPLALLQFTVYTLSASKSWLVI